MSGDKTTGWQRFIHRVFGHRWVIVEITPLFDRVRCSYCGKEGECW